MRTTTADRRMWRLAVLGPVLVLVAVATVLVRPATATQGFCGQTWGSLPKHMSNPGPSNTVLTNVRSGRHECFDRLVFELSGPAQGYRVEYVSQVSEDGSGTPVPLRGGAFLQVILASPAYDANGQATYRPADRSNVVNVTGYTTFRQVAYAGSFEGQTTFGVGVRARLPFRVFVLSGPGTASRVVLDVAHYW